VSGRPRKSSAVRVEHADLDSTRWQQHRDRQKLKAEFEAREASRGRGRAQVTKEPARRPTMADDRELKALVSRGYSIETAQAMLAGDVPRPERLGGGSGWIVET
jgi:hypothetical protein